MVGRQHQEDRVGISCNACNAPRAIAGAVLRGDRLQHDGGVFDARLQQLVGGEKAMVLAGHHDRRADIGQSRVRATVCWNSVPLPASARNCLGRFLRDTGHSRVPLPPLRMREST